MTPTLTNPFQASSDRTFSFLIKATSPRHTMQRMFSSKPSVDEAKAEVLAQFDKHFPEAADRVIYAVQTWDEYMKICERCESLNYHLNN